MSAAPRASATGDVVGCSTRAPSRRGFGISSGVRMAGGIGGGASAAEPVAPYESIVSLTNENFGSVALYSIECLRDRLAPKVEQNESRRAIPSDRVYSLDADHSPFFSAPEELAQMLHGIAERA